MNNLKRICNVFASVIYQFGEILTRNKPKMSVTKQNEYSDCCIRILTLLKNKFNETFVSSNINVMKYIINQFTKTHYHY